MADPTMSMRDAFRCWLHRMSGGGGRAEQGILLCHMAVVPLVAGVATQVLVPVIFVFSLLLFGCGRSRMAPPTLSGVLVAALYGWAMLRAGLQPSPWPALGAVAASGFTLMAGIVIIAAIKAPRSRREHEALHAVFSRAMVLSVGVYCAVMGFDALATAGFLPKALGRTPLSNLADYKKSGTFLSLWLMALAAHGLFYGRLWVVAAWSSVAVAVAFLSQSVAALMAVAGMFVIALLARWSVKIAVGVVMGGYTGTLLVLPWVMKQAMAMFFASPLAGKMIGSFDARAYIWTGAAEAISGRWLFGFGPHGIRSVTLTLPPVLQAPLAEVLHPHNAIMAMWLDLGGIGVCLLAGLLLLAARRMMRMTALAAGPACVLVAGIMIVSLIEYAIWYEWVMAFWVSSAALVAVWHNLSVCAPLSSTESG